jgi:hypothetical protein
VDAAGNVHAVRLFVVEADPAFDIAEDLQGIVAQVVSAIVFCACASQLCSLSVPKLNIHRTKLGSAYRGNEAADVCPNFGMDNVCGAVSQLHGDRLVA